MSGTKVRKLVLGLVFLFSFGALAGCGEDAKVVPKGPNNQGFYNLGWDIEFAGTSSNSPNYLLGYQINVPAATNLEKIALIGKVAGASVHIGLYEDDGAGNPQNLVAEVPATPIAVGVNEFTLAAPVPLVAGNYWYMAVYDVIGKIGKDTVNFGTIKYFVHPFGDPLPLTFPAYTTDVFQYLNYYLVVAD